MLSSAGANGAQVTLTFDEDLTGMTSPAAFIVTVDGLRWRVESAAASGRIVTLTLGLAATRGETVDLTYSGRTCVMLTATRSRLSPRTRPTAHRR